MKKLLVTAIGAAAALGAFADSPMPTISTLRFESDLFPTLGGVTTNELNQAHGTYWSEAEGATNTYAIEAMGSFVRRQTRDIPDDDPEQALSIKTTFGKPLSVNVVSGGAATNINAGLYFDSLVKFTVCEDAPDQTYAGAKIVMWLQEEYNGDDIAGTNLWVNAGYLSYDGGLQVSNAVYNCGRVEGDFADKFHRVTIKAMSTIVEGGDLIPGFAIYIDGNDDNKDSFTLVCSGASKLDSTFTARYVLTEAATELNSGTISGALFPSLIQSGEDKTTLKAASFDGTGSLSDIIFTANAPEFAKDAAAPKAYIWDGNDQHDPVPFTTLAEAVAEVNGKSSGTYTMTLAKGIVIPDTLAFASAANVILDFAGVVITNESDSVAAITVACVDDGTMTITNSTLAVGGIYCADEDGVALEFTAGELAIYGGIFNGEVVLDAGADVYGGSYKDDTNVQSYLAEGKALSAQGATYPGLYDVIDYVPTYTVTFVSGIEGQNVTNFENLASGAEMPTPPDASIAGKTYVWVPEIDSVVTSNATYTAQYTDINYTIKFVYGLNKEETNTVVKTYYQSVSEPTGTARDGYTLAWTPEIQTWPITVTHDETYEATYTPIEYTITFVAEGGTVDPASTNYTIESGAITLPSAVHNGGVGLQFDGWTNTTMTITTADLTFTPTAANLGDFTLYAKWTAGGPTYPSYLNNADAAVKAQYLSWAQTNGADTQSAYETEFLLNVAPNAADKTLSTTDVTISGTTVTIDINRGYLNGHPYVKKAVTLADLKTAPQTAIEITPADKVEGLENGGRVTLTGESGTTMFYQIGTQSEPLNQN